MHEFMSRFAVIHRQSSNILDRQLKKYNITGSQYIYILVICENPGISQEEISDKLKIDKGSVARAVKLFEKNKFIIRNISENDKRQYKILPTSKAFATYEKIHGLAITIEDRLTEGFTDIEREILKNLLDKVIINL